ncbi:MAG: DUF732 domain-containing protein [Pseudonocardia sp.]|nr:DUF732 domain-containing protein [Pseudonocardia sp.]
MAETAFTQDRPAGPDEHEHTVVQAPAVDRFTRRRLAADAAAAAAEAAAADAAGRAAAAIKAAARAAEEAEAAADHAARAADEAHAAAEAEAGAQAGHRSLPPLPAPPVNGHPVDRRGETAVIPPAREGGRRHRRATVEGDDSTSVASGRSGDIDVESPAEATTVVPLAGPSDALPGQRSTEGRRARHRAEKAAAAGAPDVSRDPVTDAIDVMGAEAPPVRKYGELDEFDGDEFDDDLDHDRDDGRRTRSPAPDDDVDHSERPAWLGRPVLYALGAVLVIIGLIVALVMVLGGGRASAPPAASGSAQSVDAPAAAAPPAAAPPAYGDTVDPTSDRAVAFLDALREGGITTSRSGISETQAAGGICNQLSRGVEAATLARSLPTQLPTVARQQAPLFIELVKEHYC